MTTEIVMFAASKRSSNIGGKGRMSTNTDVTIRIGKAKPVVFAQRERGEVAISDDIRASVRTAILAASRDMF
jgi:hypothetical protein